MKMNIKLKLLVLIFFSGILQVQSQVSFDVSKISKKTFKIARKIEKENWLTDSAIGFSGTRPAQYDNFIKLKEKASIAELTELTNHPSPAVRCYAFWALAYNDQANLFPLVLNHLNDTAWVSTQFGCIGGEEKVADIFIQIVTPNYFDNNLKKLSPAQFEILDSILIYGVNNLSASDRVMNKEKPQSALYPGIKASFVKGNKETALIALAKYQKEEDVPLLIDHFAQVEKDSGNFHFIYRAISEFPHPAFFTILKKNLIKGLDETSNLYSLKTFYAAIAAYQDSEAEALLRIPLTKVKEPGIREYHSEFIFEALLLNINKVYDELFWKFWELEKRIDPGVFNYLYPKNQQRAIELSKQSLLSADALYSKNISIDIKYLNGTEILSDLMLDLLLEKEKKACIDLINKNIRDVNVHLFDVFAKKAAIIKDPSFVEPLFSRLETEDNPHVYLEIVKALVEFQNPEINKRILQTRLKNIHLRTDWGAEALDKILKENKIK